MTMPAPEIAEDALELPLANWRALRAAAHDDKMAEEKAAAQARRDARRTAANDNDPKTASAEPPGGPLPFINPADWHGKPLPARQWFLEGLIPAQTVTMLSGDGGVGKSLLALQLAAASAMGVGTIGLAPRPGRVVYLGAEDDRDEFQRRLHDIVVAHSRTLADTGNLRIIPMAERDALLATPNAKGVIEPTANWTALRAGILRHEPGLVVLDTSADLFGGDEIKRSQVRGFVAMLRSLAIETKAAVLLLSHPSIAGMTTGTGTSGSTAWSNSVRSRLYLTAPPGQDADPSQRSLSVMKANYGVTGGCVKLRWQSGAFVADDGSVPVELTLITDRHDKVFVEMLSAVNRTGQVVAPTKGVNYAPRILAERADGKQVTTKHLEAAMRRLLSAGTIRVIWNGPPSKRRQVMVVSAEYFGGGEGPLE